MSNATEAEYLAFLKEVQAATCWAYQPNITPSYSYVPSLAGGIVFCVLFGIPFFYHTFQSIRLRATTAILLALGALSMFLLALLHPHPQLFFLFSFLIPFHTKITNRFSSTTAELIGWAARTYAAKCPYNRDAFMAQEVTLIIAPVFFSAALYVLLGKLIFDLGRGSSVLTAKWYAIIFCTCDVVSLIVQAIGGAQASTANTNDGTIMGTHIMVAGIAFQLFTMTLFGGLLADFLWRVLRTGGEFRGLVTGGMRKVFGAILVSFLMIYIRSVYRTIELAQGWHGYLIEHEGYFIGLDAAIMAIAVGVFVVIDPAVIFRGEGRPGYARGRDVKHGPESSDGEAGLVMEPVPGRY